MTRIATALVLVLVVSGCGYRKTAIAVSGGVTVASAITSAALINGAEDQSSRQGVGFLFAYYAVLGAVITAAIIASDAGETAPMSSSASWSSSDSSSGSSSSESWSSDSSPSTSSESSPTPSDPTHKRGSGYAYDRTGAPAGRVDENGYYYDRTGAPDGRIDSNGYYYDRTGAPAGRVDNTGSYYDRTGAPSGRVDSTGSFYDRTGAPAGRIDDNGYIYDRTGAPAGRVDSSCNDECRRAAVGRILIDGQ